MNDTFTPLALWGWRPFFQRQTGEIAPEQTARVVKEERSQLLLINGSGQWVGGILTGKWKKRREDFENPGVGDWVTLGVKTEERDGVSFYRIDQRLERQSLIVRKAAGTNNKMQLLAANVDVAFLVSSCNEDLDVRRIERYLSLVNGGGIKPVLVLNKCDLPEAESCVLELKNRFPDLPLLKTRSDDPQSFDQLRAFLGVGVSSVLLGSSGVGKSTITNSLIENDVQHVQEVRHQDSKGRHTTTGRSMHFISKGGGLIIDTPGLREVQLPSSETNIDETFSDILTLSLKCRFADCRHRSEPQCAVKEAIAEGLLIADRLTHFHKLQDEKAKKSPYRKK